MYSLFLVVLITVLLIAANSMAMMVRDRVTEVAVMRAFGFGRIHVVTLLFAEAGMNMLNDLGFILFNITYAITSVQAIVAGLVGLADKSSTLYSRVG
jgi:hypothetical protein